MPQQLLSLKPGSKVIIFSISKVNLYYVVLTIKTGSTAVAKFVRMTNQNFEWLYNLFLNVSEIKKPHTGGVFHIYNLN